MSHDGSCYCPNCDRSFDRDALEAELAESVRALAVSQGEVARAEELLRGWLNFGASVQELTNGLAEDTEAFLATPTASPEPDRASPEVTVKENGAHWACAAADGACGTECPYAPKGRP